MIIPGSTGRNAHLVSETTHRLLDGGGSHTPERQAPMTTPSTDDQRTGRYLYLLRRRFTHEDVADLQRWLSRTCYQCGKGANTLPHVAIGEYVAIGCGGYHQINPNVVGVPTPGWDDWTRVQPKVELGPWYPSSQVPGEREVSAKATITVELRAPAGAPVVDSELCRALLEHLDGHEFEVVYDPTQDRNGYTMIEVRTR